MDGGLGYGRRGPHELIIVEAVGKIAGIYRCEKYFVHLLYRFSEISESRS